MRQNLVRNAALVILMLFSAGAAMALRPTHHLSDDLAPMNLEASIPKAFGRWQLVEQGGGVQILDPRQRQTLSEIYSQTLSRTYADSEGNHVMLAVAYGSDQRDSLEMHYPEICYPAQGFRRLSLRNDVLQTTQRRIPVKRIEMERGAQRHEPITYWAVIGEQSFRGGSAKKLAEMRYGLRGIIPDGLLFRVSSVDANSVHAFAVQDDFVREIEQAVVADSRGRFFGSDLRQQ